MVNVLVQENELAQEHPFAYFVNKLLQQETKFSTVEIEYLGVLLALKNFEKYIFDVPVTIFTSQLFTVFVNNFSA